MPCFSQIISEMLPEILTMKKFDFKVIIHSYTVLSYVCNAVSAQGWIVQKDLLKIQDVRFKVSHKVKTASKGFLLSKYLSKWPKS